jgi:hypothetical protein
MEWFQTLKHMKRRQMRNKTVMDLEELKNRCWLYYIDDNGRKNFICNDDDILVASEKWNISEQAVRAIKESLDNAVTCVVDLAVEDLENIYSVAECAHSGVEAIMGDCGDDGCEGPDEDDGSCPDHTCSLWNEKEQRCMAPNPDDNPDETIGRLPPK